MLKMLLPDLMKNPNAADSIIALGEKIKDKK